MCMSILPDSGPKTKECASIFPDGMVVLQHIAKSCNLLLTLSFLSFFFEIPWLIFSKEFPWIFVRLLWFFQRFSGFGRGQKSLVNLRVFPW